jgi:hypothetical protein
VATTFPGVFAKIDYLREIVEREPWMLERKGQRDPTDGKLRGIHRSVEGGETGPMAKAAKKKAPRKQPVKRVGTPERVELDAARRAIPISSRISATS